MPRRVWMALCAMVSLLVASACGAPEAREEVRLLTGFESELVVGGLEMPTAFAFLPDGRILVAEKAGTIRIVENGALRERPFLDISDQVNDFYERGLLGLEVDPDFSENGFVYLLYTYENDPLDDEGTKTARLTRVTADGDEAVPGSETTILGSNAGASCRLFPTGSDCIPNDWIGHAVGDIAAAADGTLFVSIGDASSWEAATEDSLRAQDPDSLAGKILRVTRTGEGLPSNPFWNGDPGAARSKVWATGVRNAFRLTLKPGSGVPYAGDVGWGGTEEIDVVPAGANLGWPCYEGLERRPEFESMAGCRALYAQGTSAVHRPLVAWGQGPGFEHRASVTGGEFYETGPFPAELRGAYFYGDFVRGFIRFIQVDEEDRLVSGPMSFAEGAEGVVDIKVGPDGSLYFLVIATGELHRVRATSGTLAAEQTLLEPAVEFAVGTNPHSVVAGDVDADGKVDLVVANAGSDNVSVLLGNGNGTFEDARSYPTGATPKVVIVADLNGDKRADLVSADQDGNTASVLLGQEQAFARPVGYEACSRAHDVAAGDLDADGDLDLAVACWDGTVIAVLLGNGDGTFQAPARYESDAAPHSVVMHDFDGDGRLDLAVANHGGGTVGVLLGDGDGTLREVSTYGVGSRPHSIRVGDLNEDGVPDLATANDGSDDVSVLLGRGDGTFGEAQNYAAGPVPKAIAIGDLNGDGLDDVVTANTAGNYDKGPGHAGGDTVSVLLGDGFGSLGQSAGYPAGLTPFSVSLADIDGDGAPDLLTANWHGGTASVLQHR